MVSNAAGTQLYVATSRQPQFDAHGGGEDALWVLSAASGEVLHKVPLTAGPGAIAINPSGDHVYLTMTTKAGSPSLVSIDLASFATSVASIPNSNFTSYYPLGVSVDGVTVFVAGSLHVQDGVARTLLEYDAATLKITGKVALTAATYAAPVPTPDGKRLVVATDINYVDIVDLASGKVTASVPFGSNSSATGVVLSPDGNTAYINASDLVAIDIPTASIIGAAPTNLNEPLRLAISPDGSTLYAADLAYNDLPGGNTGPILSVVDTTSLAVTGTIATIGPPIEVALGSGGTGYVLNGDSSYAVEVDTAAMQVVQTIEVGTSPGQQLLSPQGVDFVFCEGNLSAIVNAAGTPAVSPVVIQNLNSFAGGSMAYLDGLLYVANSYALQAVDVSTLSSAGGVTVPLPRGTYLGQVASSTSAGLLNVSYVTFGGTGGEDGGGLVQYNPQTHQHTSMDASPFIPQSMIAAAGGSQVFAIGNATAVPPFDQVTAFSSQSGVQTVTFKGADFVAVRLSADGKTLYLVDHTGKLDFVDTATLQMTCSVPVGIQPDAISVSPDGSGATIADEKSTFVSVIDLTTRAVRGTIPIGTPSSGVAYVN